MSDPAPSPDPASPSAPHTKEAVFAMNLSLAAGLLMLAIKTAAWLLTGSAAILSDAAESVVHLAAVIFAAASLRLALRPADSDHLYGHAKISFFSAGFEGAMIILAALYIFHESIRKLIEGAAPHNLSLGTLLILAAGAANGILGAWLLWLGRRKSSLIVEAHGHHVLTDCWTSAGVLLGLLLVKLTGWPAFDPVCAILVALNILRSGFRLISAAVGGLMDKADPAAHRKLVEVLDRETALRGLRYHELRHRNAGDTHFVELHLLFPEGARLRDAHRSATAIEAAVEQAMDHRARVITHLECAADHAESHRIKNPPPPAAP